MARPHGGVTDRLDGAVRDAIDGAPCVVALGGGADSAVLLATAAVVAPAGVRAVFVDHGLDASSTLGAAAIDLAAHLDVPLTTLAGRVEDGSDLEARARDARYGAIEADLESGEIVLTGHTLDDQAETVLMRLVQGAGSTGLAGIPRARSVWRRPLLGATKAELRAIADGLGLPYVDDPANADPRFTRTRVRHTVVPVLETELGPSVGEGLARSAAHLAADDAAIAELADTIPIITRSGRVSIPTGALVTAHPAVAARVCRRAMRIVTGGSPGGMRDIEAILEAAATGGTRQLSGDHLAVVDGPHVTIGHLPQPDPPISLVLGSPVAWSGERYCLRTEGRHTARLAGGRFTVLGGALVGRDLTMRAPVAGDRLSIGTGTTPVAELMRVHGIHPTMRPVSPVVTVDAKIAAVVGVRVADWARPGAEGQRLVIEREVHS